MIAIRVQLGLLVRVDTAMTGIVVVVVVVAAAAVVVDPPYIAAMEKMSLST